jgi:hypothetical protein
LHSPKCSFQTYTIDAIIIILTIIFTSLELNDKLLRTVPILEMKMHDYWRAQYGLDASSGNKPNADKGNMEFALNAVSLAGKKRGACWNCGQTGHFKHDCPKQGVSENNYTSDSGKGEAKKMHDGGEKPTCTLLCKKQQGHIAKNLYYDPSNANKRPKWFKTRGSPANDGKEIGQAYIGQSQTDFEFVRCP